MRSRFLMLLGLGMGAVAGCCSPGYRTAYVARPLPPAPCDRCGGSAMILPPRATPVPADPGLAPVAGLSAPVLPNTQNTFAPPVAGDPPFSRFNPDGNSRQYPAVPVNPTPVEPPMARLLPPQSIATPPLRDPGSVAKEPVPAVKDPAPVVKETDEPPVLPADIPQFAIVQKGVASGQNPFPDGVKWLKAHGYKTILHICAPTETDNGAKRVYETHGLIYVSLEVGPRSLTKDVLERFNQIVADEKNQPLFVFDKNSALAGAMWYLHFRTVDGMSDEKARAESARLGFRQEQDDNHRDMWIAVQAYLKNHNP